MNPPTPDDKLNAIKEAIFRGEKIPAIKLYRDATAAGLADAKHAVEHLETELREKCPEKFTGATSRKGCLGAVTALAVVVVAVVFWIVTR
jgi:ribosomal protein L7/L12